MNILSSYELLSYYPYDHFLWTVDQVYPRSEEQKGLPGGIWGMRQEPHYVFGSLIVASG